MAGCSYCGKQHAPLMVCDERRQALSKSIVHKPVVHTPKIVHAVVHKPDPVVHNKSGEARYRDPDARRAYKRQWAADRRAGAK
jgi:hypothetical protein